MYFTMFDDYIFNSGSHAHNYDIETHNQSDMFFNKLPIASYSTFKLLNPLHNFSNNPIFCHCTFNPYFNSVLLVLLHFFHYLLKLLKWRSNVYTKTTNHHLTSSTSVEGSTPGCLSINLCLLSSLDMVSTIMIRSGPRSFL